MWYLPFVCRVGTPSSDRGVSQIDPMAIPEPPRYPESPSNHPFPKTSPIRAIWTPKIRSIIAFWLFFQNLEPLFYLLLWYLLQGVWVPRTPGPCVLRPKQCTDNALRTKPKAVAKRVDASNSSWREEWPLASTLEVAKTFWGREFSLLWLLGFLLVIAVVVMKLASTVQILHVGDRISEHSTMAMLGSGYGFNMFLERH